MTMGDITRRKFVTTVAGAGAAMTIVPRHVLGHGIQAPERHRQHRGRRLRAWGQQRAGADEPEPRRLLRRARLEHGGSHQALRDRRGGLRRPPRSAAAAARRSRSRPRRSRKPTRAGRRRTAATMRKPVRRPEPAEAEEVPRLPRDAREAEGHRRGRHRDAGPHARADRHAGHGPRQARLRAEAALLVGRGSARAGEEGEGPQDRHARWATRGTRPTTRAPATS